MASLSPSGRRSKHSRLLAVARLLGAESVDEVPWERMRYKEVAAIRARLSAHGFAPETISSTLSALRRVAGESRNLGCMTSTEYDLIREVPPAGGSRELAGREVAQRELRALLEACGRSVARAVQGRVVGVVIVVSKDLSTRPETQNYLTVSAHLCRCKWELYSCMCPRIGPEAQVMTDSGDCDQ